MKGQLGNIVTEPEVVIGSGMGMMVELAPVGLGSMPAWGSDVKGKSIDMEASSRKDSAASFQTEYASKAISSILEVAWAAN